jgi:hypothetical protein
MNRFVSEHQVSTIILESDLISGIDLNSQAVRFMRDFNDLFYENGCSGVIFITVNKCFGMVQCPSEFVNCIRDQLYQSLQCYIQEFCVIPCGRRYVSRRLPIGILLPHEIRFDQNTFARLKNNTTMKHDYILECLLGAAKYKYPSMIINDNYRELFLERGGREVYEQHNVV